MFIVLPYRYFRVPATKDSLSLSLALTYSLATTWCPRPKTISSLVVGPVGDRPTLLEIGQVEIGAHIVDRQTDRYESPSRPLRMGIRKYRIIGNIFSSTYSVPGTRIIHSYIQALFVLEISEVEAAKR